MSNPEPERICQLLQATDHKLVVYAGIDTVAFEGLCHGAHGWISGIPSMVPAAARRFYDADRYGKRSGEGAKDLENPGALDATAIQCLPFRRRRDQLVQCQ